MTVHRACGYQFVIFTNDHSPPHVHVAGPGGEAKITLEGPNGLALDWVRGIATAEMRRTMAEVQRERGRLIEAWREIHG